MVTAGGAPAPLLALLGFGLARGAISLVAPRLLSRAGRLGAAEARGASISTLTTIGYIGFVIGPAFVGAVAGATSLPIALVAVAAIGIAVAASGAAVLRDPAGGYDPAMSTGRARAE